MCDFEYFTIKREIFQGREGLGCGFGLVWQGMVITELQVYASLEIDANSWNNGIYRENP